MGIYGLNGKLQIDRRERIMNTKDALIKAIDKISEEDKIKLLSVVELYQKGVEITRFCYKWPVVKMEELSKMNMEEYFNDGLTEE